MKIPNSARRKVYAKGDNAFDEAPHFSDQVEKSTQPRISGPDAKLTSKASLLLSRIGCNSMARRVAVRWNTRLQSTAGMACVRTARIDLNPQLLRFGDAQVRRTLRHEVAHLAAHERAGRRGMQLQTHGPEWQQACKDLGIPGECAFHDLPLQRRQLRPKFFYQCPQCQVVVKRVRKFSRCTACYSCCKDYNAGVYHHRYKFVKVAGAAVG